MEISGFASAARARAARLSLLLLLALWYGVPSFPAESKPLPAFERVVIDEHFPGAYQVEVVDVNGDGKPDVVALGGGTCAWYENPTWKKRIVTNPTQTPGIISTATADLDGDGKAEIAIAYEFAMNQPTKGKLLLAHPGKSFDAPWTLVQVADVGSIHRLRWMEHGRLVPDGWIVRANTVEVEKWRSIVDSRALIVASIFGPSATPPRFSEEPAHILMFPVSLPGYRKIRRDMERGRLGGGGLGGGGFGGGGLGGGAFDARTGGVGGLRGGGLGGEGLGGGNVGGAAARSTIRGGLDGGDMIEDVLDPLTMDPKPRLVGWHPQPPGQSKPSEIGKAPVLHAIDTFKVQYKGSKGFLPVVLGASNQGVTATYVAAIVGTEVYQTTVLVPGAPGEAPKRGASEVHTGRLKDGRIFLATVEPWHGTDVAIYLGESILPPKLGPRTVIDTTLKDGHALWVADVDGDGDDEVFAGYRGPGTSLIGYDFDGETWNRTVIDTALAAQDLRGGDIDGDGTPDFVGVGGSTHNVVWYRPKKD